MAVAEKEKTKSGTVSDMLFEAPVVGTIMGITTSVPLAALLEIINREAGMTYALPLVLGCAAIGAVSALVASNK